MQRRHHYEQAFEAYLRQRRVPYVAVDEARKALLPQRAARPDEPGGSLKSFDLVIYGEGVNLLTEVKGRRTIPTARGAGRLECWVTREDIESLECWERLFGPTFEAVFAFVYWCDQTPADALFAEVFEHADRWYALRIVRLADYKGLARVRSPRWGTMDLSPGDFDRVSMPLAPPGPNPLGPGRSVRWTGVEGLGANPGPLPSLDALVGPP
jgi:hypothetical protein